MIKSVHAYLDPRSIQSDMGPKMNYEQPCSDLITEIEKSIKHECTDNVAKDYLKKYKVKGNMLYECGTLVVYGTEYRINQYIIIQGSTLRSPIFGKITKLLCSKNCAYLMYKHTSNRYCQEMDIYYVKDAEVYEVIPIEHLAAFHPLEPYLVSEALKTSVSLRHYVLEHLE